MYTDKVYHCYVHTWKSRLEARYRILYRFSTILASLGFILQLIFQRDVMVEIGWMDEWMDEQAEKIVESLGLEFHGFYERWCLVVLYVKERRQPRFSKGPPTKLCFWNNEMVFPWDCITLVKVTYLFLTIKQNSRYTINIERMNRNLDRRKFPFGKVWTHWIPLWKEMFFTKTKK